jgi:heavy metal efflux system protein
MEKILIFIVRQRLLVCIFFALCILGGVLSFQRLPIDAFPDLTNVQVQILTEARGMSPIEVEQLITIPIEGMMNGLPKVQETRSVTKFGLSIVTVVFDDKTDTYFARQLVNERLQNVKGRLPEGINPELGPIATGMGEIYQYVVQGEGYTATELKTIHDWEIKYLLRTVSGVNEVNTWGGFTQEYVVNLSPEKLTGYHLTLAQVFEALENNNLNFNGGVIEHESEQYIVRGLGRVNQLADIENVLVKKDGPLLITIKQLGTVEYGQALRQGAVTKDGHGEVVTGLVMMLKGENSREVIKRVKEKVKQIKASLPEGVRLIPFYDQTRLVEGTIHTVQTNLIEGGLLVVLVLMLMLGNWRAALIVASVIPVSLMFSFMGMKVFGITANIMSLGAIDFGMVVDGSIVLVEDIVRKLGHLKKEESRFELVQRSLAEVAKPVLFGVLIIIVVYLPVLALEGMEYKMFSPMIFTVCFILFGSLLTSLTLIPILCSFFLKTSLPEKPIIKLDSLREHYKQLLQKALQRPKFTLVLAIGLFLLVCASLPFMGSEFVPELDEGDFIIETRNLPSISLTEATKVTTRIERAIKHLPEIKTVVSKTGRPDLATDPMGVYQTDVYVILKPKSEWRFGKSKEELIKDLDRVLKENISGAHFNFTQPIAMRVDELVSGVRSDVAIKLYGEDFKILTQKAAEIEKIIAGVKGNRDLQTEKLSGSAQLIIAPDRNKLALYGVSISDLRDLIETAVIGKQVSEVLDGRKRFALRVKLSSVDLPKIENLLLNLPSGSQVPLSQVASLSLQEGLEVINRESGQRRLIVQCNVLGRDIGSFVKESQRLVKQKLKLPAGYYLEWGGQFENQQRAMKKLILLVPISIAVIFLFLMSAFSSVRNALLVLLNVPFAAVGGILALWLRGMYLSVPSAIGFIALFGVAVLNGLVLISHINNLIKSGMPLSEAIQQGGQDRLRPVLMTASVAILGFMPMALSVGPGAEIQKPLATVVIGGIFSSTLLTLLVLPVLYNYFEARQSQKELLQQAD